jgi:hypothetical protein
MESHCPRNSTRKINKLSNNSKAAASLLKQPLDKTAWEHMANATIATNATTNSRLPQTDK